MIGYLNGYAQKARKEIFLAQYKRVKLINGCQDVIN